MNKYKYVIYPDRVYVIVIDGVRTEVKGQEILDAMKLFMNNAWF